MIDVLVVEDSQVAREYLKYLLESQPDFRVVGAVGDGAEAVDFVQKRRPDVITMDIQMPRMDGFQATRKIMETNPVPIVIISASWDPQEVEKTFRAMEAGAVAVLEKPGGFGHPDSERTMQELVQTVRLMSEVKVVRRWARKAPRVAPELLDDAKRVQFSGEVQVVAIGASTGGPSAIQAILAGLPQDFPAPLLIVQHIARGFLQGMADWLAKTTPLPVHIAAAGIYALPGNVYLAPDDLFMGVDRGGRITLREDDLQSGLCPSASHLFRTVSTVFRDQAVGVLLTGMGKDGAEELRLMKERGATTIVQDRESSVVHGMGGDRKSVV